MHVDRYVNVYRLKELKILHCGLEKINQSKNDDCGARKPDQSKEYSHPQFSLFLYDKRQVNVHSSLAFIRNIQLWCDCLQGAVGSHRGKNSHKGNEADWSGIIHTYMSEKQKAKRLKSRAINTLALRVHSFCCALRRRQVDS